MAFLLYRTTSSLRAGSASRTLATLASGNSAAGTKTAVHNAIVTGAVIGGFTGVGVAGALTTKAQCQCRAPPNHEAFQSGGDKISKLESHYQYGHLTEIYQLLNDDPETSSDPVLLFHLARATYKLGLASPLPERQKALNDEALLYVGKALQLPLASAELKADVHALYAIVLQTRGAKKGGAEKRKFYEAAQEHLTAALKENRKNFLANYAFAQMNRDVAEETDAMSQALAPTSALAKFSLFNKSEQPVIQKDTETWKAVSRYAQKAIIADPTDIQSLNLLAKAKYELGETAEAKKLTVRAVNVTKSARFADERKAAKETRDLMEKINNSFEKERN